MNLKCPRCGNELKDGDDLVSEEPLPDWNNNLVCAACVYESIPDQPPIPQEQIDRIFKKCLVRINAPNN